MSQRIASSVPKGRSARLPAPPYRTGTPQTQAARDAPFCASSSKRGRWNCRAASLQLTGYIISRPDIELQVDGGGATGGDAVELEERKLGSSSIIVRMSAIRKLAVEATDNGLLAPELAAGIQRVKSAKIHRRPHGRLAVPETGPGAPEYAGHLDAQGPARPRHHRHAAGLRATPVRSGGAYVGARAAARWPVRTVPMPTWTKVAVDAWTARAGVAEGFVFRPVHRGDQLRGDRLSEKVVWQHLRPYAASMRIARCLKRPDSLACTSSVRAFARPVDVPVDFTGVISQNPVSGPSALGRPK